MEQTQSKQHVGWSQILIIVAILAMSVGIVLFGSQLAQLGSIGYIGVFLVMFLSSLTVILPAPAMPLLVAFATTLPYPWLVAVLAGLGSALGEFSGYILGRSGSSLITSHRLYKRIERSVEKWEFLTILLLAFIPNPLFDIAGIAAGTLRVPWYRFLLATIIGKVLRDIIIVYAAYYSIDWLKHW